MSDDKRKDENLKEGDEIPVGPDDQLHEKVEPHKPEPPQDDRPKAA